MGDIIVETTAGKVQGSTTDTIHVFKGIPYGASTGGKNRFRAPVKPEPWAGIREALHYGNKSPQPAGGMSNLRTVMGEARPETESEDCLVLNVWTPGVRDGGKRPVMFWCHGGGFTMGSASSALYNGRNLASRGDVVVVTVNHRLGPVGYLHLGDLAGEEYADSCNAGMLDLVAALEWVRDNIEAFGGDPENVTIFGESGGGGKVSVLLAMPDAAGLFQRAIVQSGPGLRMTTREKAREKTETLLDALGLSGKDIDQLLTLPIERIFEANAKINKNPLRGWGPVVDGVVLPHHPFDPIAPAVSAPVPLLIGTNKDEATLFLMQDQELATLDEAGLRARARSFVGNSEALLAAYRRAHPQMSPADLFILMASDHMMRMQSITQAERKYTQRAAPVFMYLFTWETPVLHGRLKSSHALEIPFVFDNLSSALGFTGDGPERAALSEKMSEAWLAFARNGVPAYDQLPTWPAYTPATRATMIFDEECRVENDPGSEARRAWDDLSTGEPTER